MQHWPLRLFQKQALEALEKPAHVICVAATGSGKSLIYENHALRSKKRMLLVTPLIALARQQAERLRSLGLKITLGAGSFASTGKVERPDPGSHVWIVSPEMLQSRATREHLETVWRPEFLVVDECHCLWDWGDGFRPAFRQVPELIHQLSIPQSLWLTATLPVVARRELISDLRSQNKIIEIGQFSLPTRLRLDVHRVPLALRTQATLSFVRTRTDPGIVFVNRRKDTDRLSRLLSAAGVPVLSYHAGLCVEERRNLERLIQDEIPHVIVATSAFGMGMDFSHLRWSLLWQAPPSLLGLAQAIGRVGRSNQPGHGVLFWDHPDFRLIDWVIGNSRRRRDELMEVTRFVSSMKCRKALLREFFEGDQIAACGSSCDFCGPETIPANPDFPLTNHLTAGLSLTEAGQTLDCNY